MILTIPGPLQKERNVFWCVPVSAGSRASLVWRGPGRPCITWRLCRALQASLSSNHLENEKRFRTPEVLIKHGIRRAMNFILQEEGRPFGVLKVGSRSEHEFSPHDIAFLQGAGNLVGIVIERERYEPSLKTALERQRVLLVEVVMSSCI
jgi:GAF domain-containing protein